MYDVWKIGDGEDTYHHLLDELRSSKKMAKRRGNRATIILANGEEIQRVVKIVSDGGQYQQGDIIRHGQKIPVYRDLSMNPFWFEDKE